MAEKFSILKEMRKETGFSQMELAILTGISVSTIRKLESGERKLNKISLEEAFKLSVVLHYPMEYFVDTNGMKLNRKYMEYWDTYIESLVDIIPYRHRKDLRYVKYTELVNPWEILEKKNEEWLQTYFQNIQKE